MRQQTEEKGNQTNQVWGLNNDPLVELAGFHIYHQKTAIMPVFQSS